MRQKFKIGDLVSTTESSEFEGSGIIRKVVFSKELTMLWGEDTPHYLFQDLQTGEHIQLPERFIRKI